MGLAFAHRRQCARFASALIYSAICATSANTANAAPSPVLGAKLGAYLDGLQVETHWRAGVHVDWQTGDPKLGDEHFEKGHTHCSAFVAAAAKQLGVYILRPPDHRQTLLANAQAEWLQNQEHAAGWRPVSSPIEAQHYADDGYLVVASYENSSPQKPGHIAIVRPSAKSDSDVLRDGPQIIQAGESNYQSTSLIIGFSHHKRALRDNEIHYFRHDLLEQDIRPGPNLNGR